MNNLDTFIENFFSTVKMLGESPQGGFLRLTSGSAAAATGLPSAGENYALFTESAGREDLEAVLSFFKDRNLPFVVPQLPWLGSWFCGAMDSYGLTERHNYTAMSLSVADAENPGDMSVTEVSKKTEADEWAEAAWTGFGGELPASADFRCLTAYFTGRTSNRLFSLKEEETAACTALLHNSSVCGLYYFATRPEFRRRKLAHRLMKSLVWQASQHSKEMVLLATEEGLPFYLNYGFNALANVPIRSLTGDI